MWPRGFFLFFVTGCLPAVEAGVIIEAAPLTPGPYLPGERVELQFGLRQDHGRADIPLRLIQFAFHDTDPALALDDRFTFDFSAQALCRANPESCGSGYFRFETLSPEPIASMAYYRNAEDLNEQIILPQEEAIAVGTIGVTLPLVPGDYIVDALNADGPDPVNRGARIDFDFINPQTWFAYEADQVGGGRFYASTTAGGELTFGFEPLAGTIVPEPITALLLAGGVTMIAMRRRRPRWELRQRGPRCG